MIIYVYVLSLFNISFASNKLLFLVSSFIYSGKWYNLAHGQFSLSNQFIIVITYLLH